MAPWWAVHGQFLHEEWGDVERSCLGVPTDGRFDTHDEVEFATHQPAEELRRRGDAEQDVHPGAGEAELAERVGEVDDGGGVDHAEPDAARSAPCAAGRPSGPGRR